MNELFQTGTEELLWISELEWGREGMTCLALSQVGTRYLRVADSAADILPSAGTLLMGRVDNDYLSQISHVFSDSVDEATIREHFASVPPGMEPLQNVMWDAVAQIRNPALSEFLLDVLCDTQLMRQFYQAWGSSRHHHAYTGGLFEHSMEVALNAMQYAINYRCSETEIAMCFVGGLLHDIGKTALYYNESGAGACVRHESLSFMVLANALARLKQRAPRLFEALCAILSPKFSPAHTEYLPDLMVQQADRLSASVDRWRDAFVNKPARHWYAKTDADGRVYKRLL